VNLQNSAAVLLIAGVAAMVASFVIGLPGIYQTPDLQERVRIIEESKARWNISQFAIGLSLVLTAIGIALLAGGFRASTNSWVAVLGAGIFVAGSIAGAVFLIRQTIDPLSSYQGDFKAFEFAYYWLALAGLLLFGIAFLQADLPAWLGYVTAGSALVYGIYFLVSGVGYPTPGLVTILTLVIGIVLLRQ
jgi:hypothetical protein